MTDTKKASIREVRSNLSEVINEVAYGQTRYVLTRRGKDMAAIVSLEDLQDLEANAGGKA